MDRMSTLSSASVPLSPGDRLADLRTGLQIPWARLFPLWRHLVWLALLFVVLAIAVTIRLDVQRLQMDLDRNDRAHRAAQVLNERLTLEIGARRRLQAMEGLATSLGASSQAPVVSVPTGSRR